MDETELRSVAAEVLGLLPTLLPDPADHERVKGAIGGALALPAGAGGQPLREALIGNAVVRAWVKKRLADTERLIDLPGDPTGLPDIYYVCPNGDRDRSFDRTPSSPPLCPVHRIPMVRG